MSVEKRGKTWRVVTVYYDGGNRKRKIKSGFKTKTEAKNYDEDMKYKMRDGYDLVKSETMFVDYYDEWLANHIKSGIKQQTILNHIATQTIVHEHLQNVMLKDMTKRRFQQFLDELSTTRTASSVHQISMRVGMCLKEAFSDGIIKTDPTFNMKFKGSHDSKSSENKFLEEDDYNKLIAYIEHAPMTLANFAIYTAALSGMRAGEVLALTYKDINVDNKTVSVTKSKTNRVPYQYVEPKTHRSIREIAMPDKYFKQLERFKQTVPTPDEHIFGEKTTQSVPSYHLKVIEKQLGLKNVSFHGLRHTHASILISKGVDIAYVSERLGHSSVVITQKTYFHLLSEKRSSEEQKTLDLLGG